ncbi:MAG: hypothetical protein Q9218_000715 [Villophora microphyllina]
MQKGELLEDTIRTVGQYTDAIVLRHPDGNAIDAAPIISPVPIIKRGDGAKEHPTQGLLDLLTIAEELGAVNGLTVTFRFEFVDKRVTSTELSSKIVSESDVINCTKVQKERFADLELYEKVKDSLTIDLSLMKDAKNDI